MSTGRITPGLENHYAPLDIPSIRKRRRIHEDPEKIEQDKWKTFKVIVEGKFPSSVVDLLLTRCSGSAGFNLIVAGSTRIDFNKVAIPYDSQTRREILATRTFSKFKNFVRCVSVRRDGKLAVAGDDTGLVQVLQTQTRSQLRRLRGHTGPVHACSFPTQASGYVLSGGDDAALRLWDISDGSCKFVISNAHKDSVRCITADPSPNQSPNVLIFASGSYDGYVKIWEFNISNSSQNCITKFLHGHPVEAIAYFPKGTLLVTAGGPEVKIWDMSGGGKLLYSIQAHMKTVTSVSVSEDGSYIVTGSLDQSIKFHCSSQFNVLHSVHLDEAVTSLKTYKTIDDIELLLIGLSDGQWQMRRRINPRLEVIKKLKITELKANTSQYYRRGQETQPQPGDILVDTMTWKRSSFMDRQIQSFQTHGTLERVIKMGAAPAIAFIEMLIEQGMLHIAVRNRNEQTIHPLFKFVNKQLGRDVTSMPVLLEFIRAILKENTWLYSTNDDLLMIQLKVLSSQLDDEYAQHQILRELSGIIELLS